VLAAGRPDDPSSRPALEELCAAYWYPLYGFARGRGFGHEDSRDLVQGFFAHLLAKEALAVADPERGRFRSFLLTSFRNFLENERARANAAKRGGGHTRVPLADAPDGGGWEPSHDATPERRFDRDWAVALLRRVLDALEGEYAARGRLEVFRTLRPRLSGGEPEPGADAGLSPGARRVALHRLRRRYREELRREVRDTLGSENDVEDEIRALFAALSPPARGKRVTPRRKNR
jgi:RNA polymerase sigma-70 factor (ECF subfamily)